MKLDYNKKLEENISPNYVIDNMGNKRDIILGLILLSSAAIVGFLVGLTMCKSIF